MGGGEGGQGAGQGPGTLFTWPQGAGAGQDGTCSCGAAVSAQAPASALGGSIQQAELQSAKWGCMAVPPGTSCTMGCSSQTGSTPSWASLQYNNATGRWWRSHHPPLLALQRPRQRPGTTQAPPRRHPGATQAPPRRHPGATQAPPRHHLGTSQGTTQGTTQAPARAPAKVLTWVPSVGFWQPLHVTLVHVHCSQQAGVQGGQTWRWSRVHGAALPGGWARARQGAGGRGHAGAPVA
jgi:hypothetical protein